MDALGRFARAHVHYQCSHRENLTHSSLQSPAEAKPACVALGISTTLPTVLRLASASNAFLTSCSGNWFVANNFNFPLVINASNGPIEAAMLSGLYEGML